MSVDPSECTGPIPITRLVVDPGCSVQTVTEFAGPYGLAFRDAREEMAEHDAEAVWSTADGSARLRRLVNSYLGVVHLQFEGDGAGALMQSARSVLGGTRLEDLTHRFEEDFDAMLTGWALGSLGTLAAPTPLDARVLALVDRLFRHEHPGVRKTAVHASGPLSEFAAWAPYVMRAWERLADEDADEEVRHLARLAVDAERSAAAAGKAYLPATPIAPGASPSDGSARDGIDEQQPIVVYRLADVPALLRTHIAEDSPLHRCAFYSAVAGPTIRAVVDRVFDELPEPPLDDAAVTAGLQLATEISVALSETTVGVQLFATRSREQATTRLSGFHAGDAASFRAALAAHGLTLIEGTQVFGARIEFVWSDVPFMVRSTSDRSVSVWAPHVVRTSPGGGVAAVMTAPAGFSHAWIGPEGILADVDAGGRATCGRPRPRPPVDEGELSPGWAAARATASEGDLEQLVTQLAAGVTATASRARLAALARDWVRYLLSDRVTAPMARVANAMLGALAAVLGDDAIADHVARATAPPR